jgi:hypothetical protein
MITLHPDRLAAERLRIPKSLLRHSRKQSGIRKVKRVFRRHSQRSPRMHQRIRSRAVAQSPQTFLEFHHPGIGRRRCSYPVRHGPPPSLQDMQGCCSKTTPGSRSETTGHPASFRPPLNPVPPVRYSAPEEYPEASPRQQPASPRKVHTSKHLQDEPDVPLNPHNRQTQPNP